MVDTGDEDRPAPENIDDWKLHLADWRWERLTNRQWKRWDVRREDKGMNALFAISSAAYWKGLIDKKWRPMAGSGIDLQVELKKEMDKFLDEYGFEPDLELFNELFNPPIPHEKIPDIDDEYRVRRINVNGVTVRYNEDSYMITVTIEGDLPTSTTDTIVSDLQSKPSAWNASLRIDRL